MKIWLKKLQKPWEHNLFVDTFKQNQIQGHNMQKTFGTYDTLQLLECVTPLNAHDDNYQELKWHDFKCNTSIC